MSCLWVPTPAAPSLRMAVTLSVARSELGALSLVLEAPGWPQSPPQAPGQGGRWRGDVMAPGARAS